MPFHQHNKNSLIWGGVVVSWGYTVRLVKGYTGAYPPLTLSLFFFFFIIIQSTHPVWTLVTSPQQKNGMGTEPNYNVFSILAPKTRKQQNK